MLGGLAAHPNLAVPPATFSGSESEKRPGVRPPQLKSWLSLFAFFTLVVYHFTAGSQERCSKLKILPHVLALLSKSVI